uniref:Tafazzin family protein n=1 Tax=Rhabditophanes sp. KR3021 TaxID=114890 RepID=A0AC35TNE4_9BILA
MKLEDIPKPVKSAFNYPWPFTAQETLWTRVKSNLMCTAVFSLSKLLFLGGINKIETTGREKFIKCLEDDSRPLITMANHRCNIDDPLIWTLLTFPEFFKNVDRYRYTLAASNICFTSALHTKLFSAGRCVPCVRGEGVFQQGMNFCIDQLNKNKWVHVFPEGKVETRPIRIKWGIARLALECDKTPLILPIWIKGMDEVWPNMKPYYPRFGKTVQVIFGDPVDLQPYLEALPTDLCPLERRKLVANILQEKLFATGNALLGIEPKK